MYAVASPSGIRHAHDRQRLVPARGRPPARRSPCAKRLGQTRVHVVRLEAGVVQHSCLNGKAARRIVQAGAQVCNAEASIAADSPPPASDANERLHWTDMTHEDGRMLSPADAPTSAKGLSPSTSIRPGANSRLVATVARGRAISAQRQVGKACIIGCDQRCTAGAWLVCSDFGHVPPVLLLVTA